MLTIQLVASSASCVPGGYVGLGIYELHHVLHAQDRARPCWCCTWQLQHALVCLTALEAARRSGALEFQGDVCAMRRPPEGSVLEDEEEEQAGLLQHARRTTTGPPFT